MQTGEKIKKIRKSKMLTQKELGELCGIAGSTIRRYENGGLNPKLETIQKIAVALEVPYTDLLSDIESKGYFMFDFSEGLEKNPKTFYISKEEIDDYKNNKREFSQEWIDQYNKMKKYHLSTLYDQLNDKGQDKALDQVEMLTKIDEYKK